MYKKILDKLFVGTADQACASILQNYRQQGSCIVDYLYFANITGKHLFSSYTYIPDIDFFAHAVLADYKNTVKSHIFALYQQAILDADIVLPDGIALQLFYFFDRKKWLDNLNGTDFCLYMLSYLTRTVSGKSLNLLLYGTYPHLLHKTKEFLEQQGYNVVYTQDGYSSLDWTCIDRILGDDSQSINVLLIARSTPDYPIQEIWSLANKKYISKYHLLVMNQWGTFDFWVGEQKRAPKLVRYLKLERLRRLILNPKRNFKKVLSTLAIFRYIFSYLILKNK